MATLSVKELIEQLEAVTAPQAADLTMAAAGRLKLSEKLRVAVEKRDAAIRESTATAAEVTAILQEFRKLDVNIRKD